MVELLLALGVLAGVAALTTSDSTTQEYRVTALTTSDFSTQEYRVTYRAYAVEAPDRDAPTVSALIKSGGVDALKQFLKDRAADPGESQAIWGGLPAALPLAENAEESDEALLLQLESAMPDGTFELVGKAVDTVAEGQVVTLAPWADEPEGHSLAISVKVSAGEGGKVLVGTHYEGDSPWFSGSCNDLQYQEAREPGMVYAGVWTSGSSADRLGDRSSFIQLITVTPVEE